MMFQRPPLESPLDQGDILEACPALVIGEYDEESNSPTTTRFDRRRVIVLTQTCDLANRSNWVTVAIVYEAQSLVDEGLLKAVDIKGAIRQTRSFGWYFLPKCSDPSLPESIIDLRQLHTVQLELLESLCRKGHRVARVQPLYR